MPLRHLTPLCYLTILLLSSACHSSVADHPYSHVPAANIEQGRLLAEEHCKSCHALPDPALLNARSWEESALPAMGPLMGIFQYKGAHYPYRGDPTMKGPGFLASNPQVTTDEWQYIVDYYTATAPAQLPEQNRSGQINLGLRMFELKQPELPVKNTHSSFVKIRPNTDAPIVVSDALTRMTYFLDERLVPIDSIMTDGPLVQIEFTETNDAIACNIGVMEPNDGTHGKAIRLRKTADRWQAEATEVLPGLHRPVQVLPTDLNRDGEQDYLICEFGYMQGGLIWMYREYPDTAYRKVKISSLAGALRVDTIDFNKDGLTDIVALFAQGEEGVFLFTNNGKGQFEGRELLRFPALYGSSYFELADFNQDGLPDILYTAGDNGDYTNILKPYHGVYIYLNQGNNLFQQAYFYPIHGCYKAMARDFDGDGDLDLATIAHYADFSTQPEEGFLYLENQGDLHFKAHSSMELTMGRWISMDVGDIEQDGRPDIILGNFVQPSSLTDQAANWAAAPPFVILKNVAD